MQRCAGWKLPGALVGAVAVSSLIVVSAAPAATAPPPLVKQSGHAKFVAGDGSTAAEALAESRREAVREYAKQFGVSAEQAKANLDLQEKTPAVLKAAQSALGKDFGALTFDNAEGRLVLSIGPDADADAARAAVERAGASAGTTVKRRTWTATDVDAAFEKLKTSLKPYTDAGQARLRIADGLIVDIAAGADAKRWDAISSTARSAAPAAVTPTITRDPEKTFKAIASYAQPGNGGPPLVAGLYYSRDAVNAFCTVGFQTSSPSYSLPFSLTAGHCIGGSNNYAWYSLSSGNWFSSDFGGYNASGGGDAGIMIDADPVNWPAAPAFIHWGCACVTLPVLGADASTAGQFYCHTGWASSYYLSAGTSCGTEIGLTYPVTYDGIAHAMNGITGSGVCGYPGDSGGPVFQPYTAHALGVFDAVSSATCNITGYYTNALVAAATLGVSVVY